VQKTIETLKRIHPALRVVLVFLAGISLVVMVLATGIDVIGRQTGNPLTGTYEVISLLCALVTAGALSYTQERKENIVVDILVTHMPRSLKKITHLISDLACLAFIALVAWQLTVIAITQWQTGEITETLGIIFYPVTFATAIGFVALALVFITDFLSTCSDAPQETQP